MSPRPARPVTEHVTAPCEQHGDDTPHALHRSGYTATGQQRTRTRCVLCHREEALASYHRRREA